MCGGAQLGLFRFDRMSLFYVFLPSWRGWGFAIHVGLLHADLYDIRFYARAAATAHRHRGNN